MESIDLLGESGTLTESILELASKAEECLVRSNNLLKSKVKKVKRPYSISYWSLFLEESPSRTTVETGGVSIGGATLLATGEGNEVDIVKDAARLIVHQQNKDGGWASFSTSKTKEESLTINTYFALMFLMKVKSKEHQNEIRRGIKWLISTENRDTGGWGLYIGDTSRILTTSYTLRAIAEWGASQGKNIMEEDIVNRGASWLIKRQNKNGSWSSIPHQADSAVQTGIALMALVATGSLRQYSIPVARGRNWLLRHVDNREGVVDNYDIPKRNKQGEVIGFHRRISHVNFPEGIILQALLACNVNLTEEILISLVRNIVDTQAHDGSWKSFAVPYEKPIYAILDASLALDLFLLRVKKSETVLGIEERVLALRKGIEANQKELVRTQKDLVDIQKALEQISASLDSIKMDVKHQNLVIEKLNKFHYGLFWLWPSAYIGNWVRRYPLIVLLIIIFIVYVVLRMIYSVNSVSIDLGTALTSSLLLLMELVYFYRSKKRK